MQDLVFTLHLNINIVLGLGRGLEMRGLGCWGQRHLAEEMAYFSESLIFWSEMLWKGSSLHEWRIFEVQIP